MTIRSFISVLVTCICITTLFSCKNSPKLTFKITQLDTTTKAIKVSILELAYNYKKYQGQYIETTGKFYQGFEEFAIYVDKNLVAGETKGFWLATDNDLNIDGSFFAKMDGKLVTVKGIIDTTSKGHLSSYPATISRIYFWQQE